MPTQEPSQTEWTETKRLKLSPNDSPPEIATVIADPTAWHADMQWALQEWEKGAFEQVSAEYVAVYNKQCLAHGNNPNELRRYWSEQLQVPFQRIVVKYIGVEE
jgi:hypothetical protein